MSFKPKPCKTCGSLYHSAWYHKPRVQMTAQKPMNKVGKVGKQTANAMAKWKRQTKTNHEGYMICYICQRWIDYKMPDHVKSRARTPELRTDLHNFKPICADCNERKGSSDREEMEGTFEANTN